MSLQSLVERKLEPVGESGNDILYICPRCDDTSGHLYVDYNKGYWHCFKCGSGGKRIESLLKILGVDVGYDYDKLYSEHEKELDIILSPKKKADDTIVDYSTDLDMLTKYYCYHIQPLSQQAYNYLLNRGLTPYIIQKLGMSEGVNRYGQVFNINGKECYGRDYSGRIMIPSMRKDGSISFYLGRDYIGDKDNKYLNPPKEIAVASEDVWSLDIIESPTVVICEGVFSAVGVNNALGKTIACATYGKSIAKKSSESGVQVTSQGEKLLKKGFKSYIMFYDKDALHEAYENASYLYDRGADVRVVRIPDDMYGDHADAGDMSKEEIIELIKKSEKFDRFSKSGLM